jgi:hypothetical protein
VARETAPGARNRSDPGPSSSKAEFQPGVKAVYEKNKDYVPLKEPPIIGFVRSVGSQCTSRAATPRICIGLTLRTSTILIQRCFRKRNYRCNILTHPLNPPKANGLAPLRFHEGAIFTELGLKFCAFRFDLRC